MVHCTLCCRKSVARIAYQHVGFQSAPRCRSRTSGRSRTTTFISINSRIPAAEGQPLSERSAESMASDRELDGRAAPTHNTGDEPREDVADAEEVRDQLYPRKAHTEQGPDPLLGC